MTFVAHVIVVLLVAAVLMLVGAVAAFVVVRRRARRRWNRLQAHAATRGVLAAASMFTAWRTRDRIQAAPAELSLGSTARARRRLSVALRHAEEAVAYASAHDAPVGELPAVCRTLRRVGDELDDLLRLQGRLPVRRRGSDGIRAQVREVVDAAHDVQSAALGACSDAGAPRVRALVRQARDEVDIVAAGLARMRSVTPH